jgi:hypothetical protein
MSPPREGGGAVSDDLAMAAAKRLADLVARYAPGLLIDIHLVGSASNGDFQPGRSDLDFVAVLTRPATEDELELLALVHRSYAADPTMPMLDGIWITEADLAAGPDATPDGPTSHDNRFEPVARGNRNPVTWAELHHARSVVGPVDAAALWCDPERLRAWTRQNVEDYWGRWLAAAQRPTSALGLATLRSGMLMWGVLGLSRLFYTLRMGEIASKTAAGEYVREWAEPRWRPIIEEALSIRRTGRGRMLNRVRRRREALAFMRMLLEQIRREYPPEPVGGAEPNGPAPQVPRPIRG